MINNPCRFSSSSCTGSQPVHWRADTRTLRPSGPAEDDALGCYLLFVVLNQKNNMGVLPLARRVSTNLENEKFNTPITICHNVGALGICRIPTSGSWFKPKFAFTGFVSDITMLSIIRRALKINHQSRQLLIAPLYFIIRQLGPMR